MDCRASTSRLLALPWFTRFVAGLKVQPVNAARVALALNTHCVLPSKVESTTLNTPGPASCSALEIVQFWNCIQECQSLPVELTAGPLCPTIVQWSNMALASSAVLVRLTATSPSKVKLANMSPNALGMSCASNAVAQLLTEPE